jgi:hypothetical protein
MFQSTRPDNPRIYPVHPRRSARAKAIHESVRPVSAVEIATEISADQSFRYWSHI